MLALHESVVAVLVAGRLGVGRRDLGEASRVVVAVHGAVRPDQEATRGVADNFGVREAELPGLPVTHADDPPVIVTFDDGADPGLVGEGDRPTVGVALDRARARGVGHLR